MLPSSRREGLASASDYVQCRKAIRGGSRSFYAASMLLPASVKGATFGLYAFCRLSDDEIDLGLGTLDSLALRLQRVCDRRPFACAADRAMADLMDRYAIPRAIPEALLEGLAWDSQGRRYETLEDLHAYAARVAGTVGVMMCLVMGVRCPFALARAADLGVAMQLTNIARDVGEDARAGRIYLPLRWLREAGLDPDLFVSAPAPSPALAAVIERLLAEADRLYSRAQPGIADLRASCRPAILAALLIYSDIGREIRANGHDSVTRRARVRAARKLALAGRALLRSLWLERGPPAAPLPAAAFLLQAIEPARPFAPRKARVGLREKFLRVLAAFERLERAEQFGD
jgi:phytoene synthase